VQNQHLLKTYLALVMTVVFWGLSFVATKVALESIPTFTLIFLRFAVSALIFLILMVGKGFPSFSGRDHFLVILTAFFEPGLYFIFETIGLQYTSAPKASLIIATIPIAVLILSSLVLGERTTLVSAAGVVLSLIGIAILIGGGAGFTWTLEGSLVGDLLIFGAVISAALYIVSARNLGRNYSALKITSLQIMYGALFYLPAFLWELPRVDWPSITFRSLTAMVYLTFFATVAAFFCYNYALTKISASRASVFINGIPVVTAVGAWLILGETLTSLQMAGGLLVLLAVFLTNLPSLKRGKARGGNNDGPPAGSTAPVRKGP